MEKEIIFEVVLKIMKLRTNDDGMCVSLFCFCLFFLSLASSKRGNFSPKIDEQLYENEIQTLSYIHTSCLKLYYATFYERQAKFPIHPFTLPPSVGLLFCGFTPSCRVS